MKVKNHRLEGVEFVPTKKHGGKIVPKGIVFHFTAGWSTEGDVNTLAKSDMQVSAHLVVGRDGKLVQILPFNVKGWHAGPSRWPLVGTPKFRNLNDDFIGIEISNQGWLKKLSNGRFQAWAGTLIEPNGKFVGSTRRTHTAPKDWPQFGHPNLGSGDYVWEPYPDAQLDALDAAVSAMIKAYPTLKFFVGHDEIDTRGWKSDPGPLFPMRRYHKLLEARGGPKMEEDEERPPPPVVTVPPVKAPPPSPVAAPTPQERPKPWYQRWDNISRWAGWTK